MGQRGLSCAVGAGDAPASPKETDARVALQDVPQRSQAVTDGGCLLEEVPHGQGSCLGQRAVPEEGLSLQQTVAWQLGKECLLVQDRDLGSTPQCPLQGRGLTLSRTCLTQRPFM